MTRNITAEEFIAVATALVSPVKEQGDDYVADMSGTELISYDHIFQHHRAMVYSQEMGECEVLYNGDSVEFIVYQFDTGNQDSFFLDEDGCLIDKSIGEFDKTEDIVRFLVDSDCICKIDGKKS